MRSKLGTRILLYNLVILLMAAPGLLWGLFQYAFVPRRRKGIFRRVFGSVPRGEGRVVWIHAVSVGEVRAVVPLIRLLREGLPKDARLYLSTTTATGWETARRECPYAHRIFFFPLDHPLAVRRALDRVRPAVFVAAETELWPNFLHGCFRRAVPAGVVNGRISDRSYAGYRFLRWFFAPFLERVAFFHMQSAVDAGRVVGIGALPERVTVTGNTKYDRSPRRADLPPEAVAWCRGGPLLAGGSTHRGEEEILLDMLGRPGTEGRGLRLVLVPRHPERFREVAGLLQQRGVVFARYSLLAGSGSPSAARVLLVDAMGLLEGFYAMADICFVGGSLVPVGGHNLLEPAMLGKPVLSGPHLHNFRDIAESLLESGGMRLVNDGDSLAEAVDFLLDHPSEREGMGRAALEASRKARGASPKSAETILSLLARS